ncbi:alpha-2,8-polysialyltransferase family protein [Streptomyces sp. TRM75563]|uniref:alpha-2,8-polysialyltransferase family protein n=1 Tax=Streptomyces sp. TRM75563 TaxID=2817418 RepID=UPI001F60E470|nr:alpha-2,8-polysialyltransferase family protein [Streptomyces sp. TRM75563]MCI4044406.1 alpha-2,8-polysialyltransferase family protein [Streptomyces sp. TRM75563]
MTIRIFHASSPAATVLLAAAIDACCFTEPDRRILLLSRTGPAPEAEAGVTETIGFERLRARFDEVLSWNDAIFPFHPDGWLPRADDAPLWERHFRRAWGLGEEPLELVVDSPHAGPARALTQVFAGVPVDVYAEGPGGYGPTGEKLPPPAGTRVRRLLHPDLVPGVRPLLLGEYGVEPQTVPVGAITKVMDELADLDDELSGAVGSALELPDVELPRLPTFEAPALLLGQDLAGSGLIPAAEEAGLRLEMVRGAAALGHTRLVFAPDPYAPWESPAALLAEADRLGVGLTVLDTTRPVPADVLLHRLRPALVVGCTSAALFGAARFHGLPVATVGTGLLLERLTPYENAERIPATLADAVLPALDDAEAVAAQKPGRADEVDGLLAAVGFAMRPKVRPDLRPAAERFLSAHLDGRTWRYFKRRRLASLALPGVVPARLAFLRGNPALRRVARRARALRRGGS